MKPKLILNILLVTVLFGSLAFAQRAKIKTEAVTPHQLGSMGLTQNSVSSGLDVVGNGTYVYFSAQNIANSDPVISAVYEFISKPTGSQAVFETINTTWAAFKPDVKGAYNVKLTITTAAGTDDTTKTIYSSDYVGVGNYEGVAASYPNCMTCHQNSPLTQGIFERWKESGHAKIFKREMTNAAGHYGANCMKCHTVGMDHNVEVNNNGFDDVAASLGWSWNGNPNPGKWDTLMTQFPGLVNFATIGCENCHGAGSEHTQGANPSKIDISLEAGVCGQCHDEPWRHNKYSEFENSLHAEALWSSSFAQGSSSQNNSLGNCIRCHDAEGYVNFTKGMTTNTTGMIEADHEAITCATCHDPHGNDNHASLRYTPAGSDTLGNGYQYTIGGAGMTCMNCHKARRDNVTYSQSSVNSSHWGPHHSVQTDILLGQNAAEFGAPYLTSPHKWAVEDACVGCHMQATTDTGTVTRDRVGGHSFKLYDEENDFYLTAKCESCHGSKSSWNDFTAKQDYDGNGLVEGIPDEVNGLITKLKMELPPEGVDTVSWEMIRDADSLELNKAYFNLQLVEYDGSKGMHNTMFVVDVLRKSIQALGGAITDVKLETGEVPESFVLSQNYPNPFNPSTVIRYSIPYESQVKITIYSITGEVVKELVNSVLTSGTYESFFNSATSGISLSTGVYLYSIEAKPLTGEKGFRETKKMLLMK